MQDAGTVLEVLRERGRKGLPCDELYRQMFNKSLYLLAYGQHLLQPGGDDAGGLAMRPLMACPRRKIDADHRADARASGTGSPRSAGC